MSEHSKGPELRYHDGVVCDANGRLRAVLYSDPQLLDAVLYSDRVTTERAMEERDALGRKMAASPDLVEAVRRALWHVTGDCDAWIRSAVKEFETETGRSARDAVGYTMEFHSWCQAREAEDAAFLRAALEQAGVKP